MTKFKLPIIIAVVLVAALAGLKVSGVIGGASDGPVKKHAVEPVPFAEPFRINTNDSDEDAYALFNVAMELAPLDEEHWLVWSGAGGGGHGGATEAPGPKKLAIYPKYRNAVIYIASSFSAAELRTEEGKGQLRKQLLEEFAAIAEADEALAKSSAEAHEVAPPYHIQDVFLMDLVVA